MEFSSIITVMSFLVILCFVRFLLLLFIEVSIKGEKDCKFIKTSLVFFIVNICLGFITGIIFAVEHCLTTLGDMTIIFAYFCILVVLSLTVFILYTLQDGLDIKVTEKTISIILKIELILAALALIVCGLCTIL